MVCSECGTSTKIKRPHMNRSPSSLVLTVLLFLLVLGALPAGISLVIDPSGAGIGLPLSTLEQTPFRNFFIPGLLLLLFLGLIPIIPFFGLVRFNPKSWFSQINPDKKEYWALVYSYYVGILLILWIAIQLLLGVPHGILHFAYTLLGVIIVFLSKLPATGNSYKPH